MQQTEMHRKFLLIFQEECSLLPSIFKIIEEKIKYLLTLKNISNIDSLQFYRWITTLKHWKKYFDHLDESHPLLNHQSKGPAAEMVQELIEVVIDNIRKAVQAMNLSSLLFELTHDYMQVFHKVEVDLARTSVRIRSSPLCTRTPGNRPKFLLTSRTSSRTSSTRTAMPSTLQ